MLLGTPRVYSSLEAVSSLIRDFFDFFAKKAGCPQATGFRCSKNVCSLSALLAIYLNQADGSAGHELAVEGYVHGVNAVLLELEALEVHDKVAGEEGNALGKSHLQVADDGHALLVQSNAVLIRDGDAQLVVAGILHLEAETQGQSAGGVDDGELTGEKRIEGALHAELTLIVGGVVAKDCNLDIHGMCN